MTPVRLIAPAVALATTAAASPAFAELPDPVRAMVDAAIATGDKAKVATVIDIAKATNPDDVEELNALHDTFKKNRAEAERLAAAEEERRIREAGLLANWSGQGQIGAFQSAGNTDSIGLSAALSLTREGIDWTHKMKLAADYQRTNGVTSREQFLARYEPRYQFSERAFVFGMAQFERDRFQGHSARYALSGGLGWKLVDTESMDLSIKAGPAYRRTEFVDGTSNDNLAALFGLDFDWQLADKIKLTNDTSATTEGGGQALVFIDSENISLSVLTGIEAKINSSLSTRLSYSIEYDSNPPANKVKTDTLTRFTLVYGF
ncbi:DUF481 domain-containing protein [Aurantiacibacter xanthus]|uniref:DUF481 domain-containing protein n=1 Tax=Aurantiacibacter xanthus TaxID=1784712 RepID=A0A3A1P0H2_9SPHN|nr:DUF481 domain-containing protein [Aurantiacibacter xanthus]RIV80869.1 DUF481 domain-containing protein [Aurantiacibacter xanthus]